jgi:chemotaxis protein MotB
LSRRRPKPVDTGPGWLATYGDLVTLLFAFFVMLFAISSVESEKFEAFVSGLGHFDNAAAEPGIWDVTGASSRFAVDPSTGDAGQKDAARTEAELEQIEDEIIQAAEAAGVLDSLSFRPDARGIAAAITTDQVLFATGSTELTSAGRRLLDGVADVLARLPYDVTIEGHADSVPLDRSGYTNWNLSTDRAVSVVHHLIGQGIGTQRLAAAGFADQRPTDPTETADARTKNRRVEIVIHARPVPAASLPADTATPGTGTERPSPLPRIDVLDPSTLRTTSPDNRPGVAP